MSDIHEIQSALGITFRNPSLLQQAFIHPSYVNENPGADTHDNQRMEFLGDALLNMIFAELLYREFPNLPEGKLTELRISMIRQEKLAEKSSALKLGGYMVLGKGEDSSGGRGRRNNLADTFEALVAAIFLDQGISKAREFVLSNFARDISSVKAGKPVLNYKALLQELMQAKFKTLPGYEIIEATGPDHDKVFCVSVSLGEVVLAIGSGKTRKVAESEAARIALEKLSLDISSPN
ncbi:MAG: ribonuclease III [Dehalococcoidia bacterium]